MCIINKDSNKTMTCQYFLPFEINSVLMKNTTIFTISSFCEVESFRVFRFPVVVSSFLVVLKETGDSNTRQFLSIFSRTSPLLKALYSIAGFKAIPTHLWVPLRHSGGGLLWLK